MMSDQQSRSGGNHEHNPESQHGGPCSECDKSRLEVLMDALECELLDLKIHLSSAGDIIAYDKTKNIRLLFQSLKIHLSKEIEE